MARGVKKAKAELTPEEKLAQALVPVEEQPYKVPGNWCWVHGNAFLRPMETKRPTGDMFCYIDIDSVDNKKQEVTEPKRVKTDEAPSRASRALHPGDTIFSMVRPYLKNIAYIDNTISDSIASTGFYVCSPRIGIVPRYNYYMLVSPYVVDGLNAFMKGDNSPSIHKDNIEQFPFPIPPTSEQQRIVDRIESLFTKLDEAKEKAQAVVDSYEDRKAAILHEAFTGNLTARWRKMHGITLSEWKRLKISEFASVRGGKRLPKGCALTTEKTAHPYLRIADFGDDTINLSDIHYITDEVYNQISRYIINKNDVYISIVGTIGKCGTIPDEFDGANLTENAARITTTITLPRYLVGYLSSPSAQEDIKSRIRSATLGKLSLLNINSIVVPIPSKDEQQEIVNTLDKLLYSDLQAKESAEQTLAQIDAMKKAILARAFRGELGTNDPSDESAEALLKSIL